MISHEDALELIRRRVSVLGTEDVDVAGCVGRILAADLTSAISRSSRAISPDLCLSSNQSRLREITVRSPEIISRKSG